MTKALRTFILIQLFVISIVGGQCNFDDPLHGFTAGAAKFLCGEVLDGYSGTLPSVNSPGIQPGQPCGNGGTVENVLWFSFIPTTFNLNISISYTNCTGGNLRIQAGIYEDTLVTEPGYPGVVACNSNPAFSPLTLTATGLNIGQLYYLIIDGDDSSVCDFRIRANSGVSNAPAVFNWEDGENRIRS